MNPDDAERIAKKIMRQYAPGWTFTWYNAKTQFGLCCYGPRVIKLSRPLTLINDQPIVEQVMLHEMAHVLAGEKANHGRLWKAHAISLGVPPTPCTDNAVSIEGDVLGTCELGCGYEWRQHKITYHTYTRTICPNCSNREIPVWVYLDWTRNGVPIPRPKKPKPRRRKRRYARL